MVQERYGTLAGVYEWLVPDALLSSRYAEDAERYLVTAARAG
jgi:hypothetical protein